MFIFSGALLSPSGQLGAAVYLENPLCLRCNKDDEDVTAAQAVIYLQYSRTSFSDCGNLVTLIRHQIKKRMFSCASVHQMVFFLPQAFRTAYLLLVIKFYLF